MNRLFETISDDMKPYEFCPIFHTYENKDNKRTWVLLESGQHYKMALIKHPDMHLRDIRSGGGLIKTVFRTSGEALTYFRDELEDPLSDEDYKVFLRGCIKELE